MSLLTKILVADDSAFMRQFIIGYLHEAGYENIIEAGNGKIALEKFDLEHPDVVLLDLIMPVETGLDTLPELVKRGAKVIVVSAMGQKSIIDKAIEQGAKAFFIKPFFTVKELGDTIKEVLD
ncbi:MAG: response regulator [Candidatus Uhrbacteria bacterium]